MSKISIIIPIYNSHEIVRRQILHFKRMDLPVEIIFVDDGSCPPIEGDYVDIYRTDSKLAWTQGIARNLGASKATGDYLFFTDIDHILSGNAVKDALLFNGNKMIFRRQIAVLDEQGYIRQDKHTLSAWGYDNDDLDASVHGNTFVIKKSVFDELGGYDVIHCTRGYHPISRKGEDCYFNAKWNKRYKGTAPIVGSDIYMFPIGRYNNTCDLNPFGLFHSLHQREEVQYKCTI